MAGSVAHFAATRYNGAVMYIVVAQRITLVHRVKGGMEVQADLLNRGLVARGQRVEVITTAHPDSLREVEEVDLHYHFLPRSDPRRYTRGWWNASYEKLKELSHRGRAELLLSQSAGALPYVARAQRELGLPVVLLAHTGLNSALYSQWRAARSLRGALFLAYTLSQAPWHWWLWRRATAAADAIITPSEETAHDVQAEFGADPACVHVIPNGVDLARFAPAPEARAAVRERLGLAPDALVAIAVTRLVPEKGLHVALEALPRVPRLTLLVAGDGTARASLEREAQERQIAARVRFLGYVPNEQLPEYLAAADVFVMPTLCREGFPVSVVEAMATGLVPVASHIGGIPTAVDAERTGVLVPPGQPEALASALARLAGDAPRRLALAAAARAEALERFSVQRMVDDTLAVLEQARAQR
jgi:glycosyltransferase involved in cell wall biosynthesis